MRFVSLAQTDRFTISSLCEQFGISRKTGHKWLERYREAGMEGLGVRWSPKVGQDGSLSQNQNNDSYVQETSSAQCRIESQGGA